MRRAKPRAWLFGWADPGLAILLAIALATTALAQQGNLSLTVAPGPSGFATTSTTTCGTSTLASLSHVLRTEPLNITLQSSPTHVNPPPLIPVPRRVALFIGVKDCSGSGNILGTPVFISLAGTPGPAAIFDSFANVFDPVFGPPVLGPSFINLTVGLDLSGPYAGTLPPLVLQAVTEDLPNTPTPFFLSNAVEVNVIDPQTGGFAPTVTGIASSGAPCTSTGGPGGLESATNTTITLTGTNFPVHTNWIQYPPTVMVGTTAATGVVILSPTTATAVVPPPFPLTCPPSTPAGPKDVTFLDHASISPGALPALSPIKFTYCSGRTPAVATMSLVSQVPEGGATLHLAGTNFLHGADVVFTSQAAANLTTTISPPDAAIIATGTTCAAPTPTQITLTTPPFCAGPVSVKVVNPDGVMSAVAAINYDPQPAQALSGEPAASVPGLAIPSGLAVMAATGSPVNVFGTGFISPSSPLFNAPTVPQGPAVLFPSRTEILEPAGGAVLYTSPPGASGVTAQNAISLTPAIPPPSGAFRSSLGVKRLRVLNCPCVDPNAPSPTAATVPILIQDAAPPTVTTVFPNLVTPAGPGGAVSSKITITGANFFARKSTQPLPFTQTFGPTAPTLEQLEVPAVSFNGVFSTEVDLDSETQIRAKVPAGLALQSAVTITVYNPDGRFMTAPNSLLVVPRLTDPTQVTPSVPGPLGPLTVLDAATLLAVTNPLTNPFRFDESILFVPNPTAADDRLEDLANGGDPSVTGNPSAYDAAFLFNTRNNTTNGARFFDFQSIDVPSTIILPAPINLGTAVISAGLKRVIFKATSFFVAPPVTTDVYIDENYPLVLRSHDDFTFSGLMDVSGDALVSQNAATSPSLKFHLRCEWQIPPAGGGIGGRGGMHYFNDLIPAPGTQTLVLPTLANSLTQPSLGTTAAQLIGRSGFQPQTRTPVLPTDPLTYGRYGLGRAPVGGLAGGGGGGGHALPGGPGQAGATASVGTAGIAFGNHTNLPAGTPGRPDLGDAYIYGGSTTPSDFAGPLGLSTPAFPHGLFAGGSGGGGGGGSLAIVFPCASLGGRGGNGGGSVVLLSDRIFKLGMYGRIFADGEKGQLGIDAFPIANGEPIFVLCAPGSGGGGAGGSIFIAAVIDANLGAPILGLNQHMLSADGGPGGAPTGSTTVTTAHGGAGGPGRIRVAINALSSTVSQRQSEFGMRTSSGNISPNPSTTFPVPGTPLPIDFFRYPSP